MNAHPPAHEVAEPWHEDLSEQGVSKDHFIRTKLPRFCGICIIVATAALWLIIALVWLLTSALLASGAYAHEAPKSVSQPLGWTYGWECCSLRDCAPVEKSGIGETSTGYVIRQTGEVIAYGDTRIKRSKDELYHRCTPAGDMDAPRSICLYVPDRGF